MSPALANKGSYNRSRSEVEVDRYRYQKRYVTLEDLLNVYGNTEWHRTITEARHVIAREPPVTLEGEPINFKPIPGLERAYDLLTCRYVEYVNLLNLMVATMEDLVHPQKRVLFKHFIESVAGRVCELKYQMTKLAGTNIHNLTRYMLELGVTPTDLEYRIPLCLLEEQRASMERRQKLLSTMHEMMAAIYECSVTDLLTGFAASASADAGSGQKSRGEAEPTRISRQSAKTSAVALVRESKDSRRSTGVNSKISLQEVGGVSRTASSTKSKRRQSGKEETEKIPDGSHVSLSGRRSFLEMQDFLNSRRYKKMLMDPKFHMKVHVLQRRWRMWLCWQSTRNFRREEHASAYMDFPPETHQTANARLSKTRRQTMCAERMEEYNSALKTLTSDYMTGSSGSFDVWQHKLNLEQWLLELRDLLGKRPPYPEPDIGGCSILFSRKTIPQVIEELENLEDSKDKKSAKKKDTKDKKKKKDEKKSKGGDKKNKDEGFQWMMPNSGAIPRLALALQEYAAYWNVKREDISLAQRYDLQLAKEKTRSDAEDTIRNIIDALMIAELDRLRVVDREPRPKPDKKKKKDKKGKKGKKSKDPTGGRSVEELFSELVLQGIICKPLEVSLEDYAGVASLVDKSRETCRLATPGDLKMVMREEYGLPLTCPSIHSMMPVRNSVLLAGPPGAGKKLLVHGLCRETGANLIDLSPVKLVDKYTGKKQEDYLMGAILKVSKSMEPTIVLVDECHLMFPTKKSPKRPEVDQDKPARWAKALSRLIKKLKPGDRMLVVGVTNLPFSAKSRPMFKLFPNTYLVPFPEYGSRVAIWQYVLNSLSLPRPHKIDVSVMAKLSEGFTGGGIRRAVESSFPPERQARKVPLSNSELIRALAQGYASDSDADLEDWIKWYQASPVMKARASVLRGLREEEEAAAAAKKK